MIQFDKHIFQRGGSTTNYIASNLGMLNHIDRSRFICIDIQVIQFQRVGLLQWFLQKFEASPKFPLLTTHQNNILKNGMFPSQKIRPMRSCHGPVDGSSTFWCQQLSFWIPPLGWHKSITRRLVICIFFVDFVNGWVRHLVCLGGQAWTSVFCLILPTWAPKLTSDSSDLQNLPPLESVYWSRQYPMIKVHGTVPKRWVSTWLI